MILFCRLRRQGRKGAKMFRLTMGMMLMLCSVRAVSAHQEDKSVGVGKHNHHFFIGIDNNSYENGKIEVYWNNLIHSVAVKAFGDIELTDDETDIKSISKDGFVRIKERNWLTYRSLEITCDNNGKVRKRFTLQGRNVEFDSDAQLWLAGILPDLARRSGIGAKYRIQKIADRQGMHAAVNEISLAESDYAIQIYLETILNHDSLNSEMLNKAVVKASREMSSSSRLREILVSAAKKFPEDSVLTSSLMRAARNISSSSGHSEALIAIANIRRLDNLSAVAMARSIEEISSSSAQGHALEMLADRSPNSDEALFAYLQAVETVSSSSEQGHALMALLRKKNLSKQVFLKILGTTESISSSSMQGEVLASFSYVCPSDDEILTAYLKTAGGVSSSSEQEHAVTAMLNKENLSVSILMKTLDFSRDEMSSRAAANNVAEKVTSVLAKKAGEKK
jgi:hypothetical protein